MTFREIAAEFKQLPINERLLLLEELTRSLRMELIETGRPRQDSTPKLWRGMLKPAGASPSDQEIEDAYADYLIEKYQ